MLSYESPSGGGADAAAIRSGYSQFILLGDSITESCETADYGVAFGAVLRNAYIRRLDVVNRGFSGYTAAYALELLPLILPTPAQADVRVLSVFFGANDACLPGNAQHVPLDTYVRCLRAIVEHAAVTAHARARVILIQPAPVDEHQLVAAKHAAGEVDYVSVRTAANTKRYADACRQLGRELGIPVIALWDDFMALAGWNEDKGGDGQGEQHQPLPGSMDAPRNDVLAQLLVDGLHFTRMGYQVMYEKLEKVIATNMPDLIPEHMPFVFPPFPPVAQRES